MFEWSDIAVLLALSASLNFGFAAFSQIRETSFQTEKEGLSNVALQHRSMRSDMEGIRSANLQQLNGDEATLVRQFFLHSEELNLARNELNEIEEQDRAADSRFPLFSIACGVFAIAILFWTPFATLSMEKAHASYYWAAIATNSGWSLFMALTVITHQRLHFNVQRVKRRVRQTIFNIENSDGINKLRPASV